MPYEIVIGLEVHVELSTRTKLFCGCPNRFGAPPSSLVCPVCLGLPGTLPVPNRRAVELLVQAGRALGCRIAPRSRFDRKNYFYPDMPKDYQISQYDLPLAEHGHLDFEVGGSPQSVRIRRIHLEEDTGKSVHVLEGREGIGGRLGASDYTLVDYNRAGVPLLEIVSEPDLRAPEEASAYLQALRDILRWLDVSDCKMEEGSLRCDANISLRPAGTEALGVKTEIKNMNSFRSVQAALAFEAERQRGILEAGGVVRQETRAWDEDRGVTLLMRSKEHEHDYRYFPDPDLVPLEVDAAWLAEVDGALPELPATRRRRYQADLGLGPKEAELVTSSREFSDFFEAVLQRRSRPREAATWMANEVSRLVKDTGTPLGDSRLAPEHLAEVLRLVEEGRVSNRGGRDLVERLYREGGDPERLVEALGLAQISGEEHLRAEVRAVVEANPGPVAEFQSGKEKALNMLVGQLMKRTQGRANPQVARRLLLEALGTGERSD